MFHNSGSQKYFWFKRVLDRGPEQRESKLTVLCMLIIIILISYIILLIMENYPSQNQKRNSGIKINGFLQSKLSRFTAQTIFSRHVVHVRQL
jgi:hypothetical protein